MSFKNKIKEVKNNQSLSTKSAMQPLDLDSTIWYLEAASNFTFADAGINYGKLKFDSVKFTIPISNGKVNWTDISLAYDKISDSLNLKYSQIPEENKQLKAADLKVTKNTGSTVTIKTTTAITYGSGNPPPPNYALWWKWGEHKGNCVGDYVGQRDVTYEIEDKANLTIPVIQGGYFTDIQVVDYRGGEGIHNSGNMYMSSATCYYFDWTPQPGYGDKIFFYMYAESLYENSCPTWHDNIRCFSPNDIDHFVNNIITLNNFFVADQNVLPKGKQIISYNVYTQAVAGSCGGDDRIHYLHRCDFTYGTWHKFIIPNP